MHVIVIVLGDLGRSPRMQYHALSLLEGGHSVSLVGYEGEELIPALAQWPDMNKFRVIRFLPPALNSVKSFKPIYFVLRILSLSLWLLWALLISIPRSESVDCVLVQNPPALPLLAIALLCCQVRKIFFRQPKPGLIIDWHNLGYSMLSEGSFQRIAKLYEKHMAPLADGHLTVTKAMKEFLLKNILVKVENPSVSVLYDCPPSMFQPLDVRSQHEILSKLDRDLCYACPKAWYVNKVNQTQTLFTERLGNDETHLEFRRRPGRPALVTSSTSWTPDEDFGILLKALEMLDEQIRKQYSALRVLVVVTGKGPEKEMYEEKISKLQLHSVAIQTVWLEPGDYPKLLACADLGISLHTSTSGLDLPMKVLDLFGCHVPVCAYSFNCLPELVQDDVNGRVFRTSEELSEQLFKLLQPLTNCNTSEVGCHSFGDLQKYSKALENRDRWSSNWTSNALPLIKAVSAGRNT